MNVIVLDQHDSFVWNIVQAVRALVEPNGGEVRVVRSDDPAARSLETLHADAAILSPGPGRPEDGAVALEWIREAPETLPMLGVCLGHQELCLAAGAQIVRDPEPVHGRSSLVQHEGHPLFADLERPFSAARYHSLHAARPVPDTYEEIAWIADDTTGARESVMAVAHRELPRFGVQFHPESILSPNGSSILARFLEITAPASSRSPRPA